MDSSLVQCNVMGGPVASVLSSVRSEGFWWLPIAELQCSILIENWRRMIKAIDYNEELIKNQKCLRKWQVRKTNARSYKAEKDIWEERLGFS